MHSEIKSFFARMKLTNGYAFNCEKVLECGSYDINGNPRGFFTSAKEYVGLDWRPGPGVDVVGLVHNYDKKPDGYFGFIIATSLLEHDPYWKTSIARIVALLQESGSLIITCGGPGFHEHEIETAPAHANGVSGTYYSNRTVHDIVSELTKNGRFMSIIVEDDPMVHDVRVCALAKMPMDMGFVDGQSGVKEAAVHS